MNIVGQNKLQLTNYKKCKFTNTVFPLISAPRRLLNFETGVWRLLEGGAYFKVREMNNIKCQNFVTFPFKIRMKHKFSLSIIQI